LNSLGPLSGQRAEWGRIFSEGLQEVNDDLFAVLENRNRFAGALDPSNRAPYVYSPVTGQKANGYGFMQRVWNAYSPIKIHSEQSPEEKFLEAMEFDVNTTFRSKDGVRLTAEERSELFRMMGESGHFRGSIREIMRDAKDWESIPRIRALRMQGKKSDEVILKKWDNIHVRLNQARRDAEEYAYAEMDADMFAAIELRQLKQQLQEEASMRGEAIDVDQTLNIRR